MCRATSMELSICEKSTMLDAFDEKCGTHLEKAEAWLLGHELRNWATEQDVTNGIAPSSRHIRLQRRTVPCQGSTGADRSERSARWKNRPSNQWVHRRAKRHKVTQGAFKGGEREPLQNLAVNSTLFWDCRHQRLELGRKGIKKSAPENGLESRTANIISSYGACPFSGPDSFAVVDQCSDFGRTFFQTSVRLSRPAGAAISGSPWWRWGEGVTSGGGPSSSPTALPVASLSSPSDVGSRPSS